MAYSVQKRHRRNTLHISIAFALLVVAQILVFSILHLRQDFGRELKTQAAMIAHAVRQGGMSAERIDRANLNSNLVLGCLFDRDGDVIFATKGAQYGHYARKLDFVDSAEEQCSRYNAGLNHHRSLITKRANIADRSLPKGVGEVLLIAAPGSLLDHYGWGLAIFLVNIFAVSMLCWWMSTYLRRTMLRPIRQIATTAQRVSLYKDYSLRVRANAVRDYPQEIELLIESFNAMLVEIEDRDARLTRKTMELEKARQHAEAANIAKTQFLANMGHELRTPLNAIIGFSTMLQSGRTAADSEKAQEYARDIHDSGKHLLDVINDILDLSNAESGNLAVRFEQVALPKLIEKALNIIAGQAAERNIEIVRDIPTKLPKIVGDRVRLMQILLNILSNAIKFSQPGGRVTIRVRAESGRSDVTYFTLDIEDHGIGMAPDEIGRAFTSFNQGDAGLSRRYEGVGLGLPLAKRLVELHHGRIMIESTKGQGTKVTIRLVSDPALLD